MVIVECLKKPGTAEAGLEKVQSSADRSNRKKRNFYAKMSLWLLTHLWKIGRILLFLSTNKFMNKTT